MWFQVIVNYAENLTLEGKGIVSNTNTDQLVLHTFNSLAAGSTFNVPNAGCSKIGFTFGSVTFTASPAVFLRQNNSNIPSGDNLIKTIINVTSNGAQIQFCNQTGATIILANQTFSIMAIGK